MKILITGASGFIGSFIVEEALRRGMETWAAVRRTSSRGYLTDPRINFIELNLGSEEELTAQLRGKEFDYVVHAAGATKCLDTRDFFRTNTEGTKHLAAALAAAGVQVKRFVYLSSLSVFGAIREKQPYQDIEEGDTPRPNTAYGQSKLEAEQWLRSFADDERRQGRHFDYVVLRPTGVYGPREKDYFLMAKSIKNHSDFAVGFTRQDITFVYVSDVVQAVFLALDRGSSGRAYFLTDGEVYQSATFSRLIKRELGVGWWLRITAPIWLLRVITAVGDAWGHLTGTITALNNDKYHILKQRNWRCNIAPAKAELGYEPQVRLEEGVRRSIKWYKENGWL